MHDINVHINNLLLIFDFSMTASNLHINLYNLLELKYPYKYKRFDNSSVNNRAYFIIDTKKG